MRHLISILFICLHANFAFAANKSVAKCGEYLLSQDVALNYFAGIEHRSNSYFLVDEKGEESSMTIETNSEGAILQSEYLPDGLSIYAMGSEFYLTKTEEKNGQSIITKTACQKLK